MSIIEIQEIQTNKREKYKIYVVSQTANIHFYNIFISPVQIVLVQVGQFYMTIYSLTYQLKSLEHFSIFSKVISCKMNIGLDSTISSRVYFIIVRNFSLIFNV